MKVIGMVGVAVLAANVDGTPALNMAATERLTSQVPKNSSVVRNFPPEPGGGPSGGRGNAGGRGHGSS